MRATRKPKSLKRLSGRLKFRRAERLVEARSLEDPPRKRVVRPSAARIDRQSIVDIFMVDTASFLVVA